MKLVDEVDDQILPDIVIVFPTQVINLLVFLNENYKLSIEEYQWTASNFLRCTSFEVFFVIFKYYMCWIQYLIN